MGDRLHMSVWGRELLKIKRKSGRHLDVLKVKKSIIGNLEMVFLGDGKQGGEMLLG